MEIPNQETYLVFGYGSLMNEESHTVSVGAHTDCGFTYLHNYERIFNLNYGKWVFLNIQPRVGSRIYGNIISVSPVGLDALLKREVGYELVNVSKSFDKKYSEPIYTFIAPPQHATGLIKQSYINKCMLPLPLEKRKKWLEDSIITNKIFPDEDPILVE